MMPRALALASLCVALLATPPAARACSRRHMAVFEMFDLARDVAVVRVGKVPGTRYGGPVALRVQQGLKGATRTRLVAMETNTSCATGFRTGRTALVWLMADRWPIDYVERPTAALVQTLAAWAAATTDAARADVLVAAITGTDPALRYEAAVHLTNRPTLLAALTPVQIAALAKARGADRAEPFVLMVLARLHGTAWRALVAAGAHLPSDRTARGPLAALAAHDDEAITDPAVLADLIVKHPGEAAPERIAAFERCERVHGHVLENFTSYGTGRAEHWWLKLAEACRTGAPAMP